MKATGLGMSLEPQSFEVLAFAQGRTARVMGHDWRAWSGLLDDCRVALCADEPLDCVQVIEAR